MSSMAAHGALCSLAKDGTNLERISGRRLLCAAQASNSRAPLTTKCAAGCCVGDPAPSHRANAWARSLLEPLNLTGSRAIRGGAIPASTGITNAGVLRV